MQFWQIGLPRSQRFLRPLHEAQPCLVFVCGRREGMLVLNPSISKGFGGLFDLIKSRAVAGFDESEYL